MCGPPVGCLSLFSGFGNLRWNLYKDIHQQNSEVVDTGAEELKKSNKYDTNIDLYKEFDKIQ